MNEDILSKYNSIKNELDEIYDHMTYGKQIRSKCGWYEMTFCFFLFFFFFYNLEKQRGSQNTIKKLADDKKFADQTHCRTQIIL